MSEHLVASLALPARGGGGTAADAESAQRRPLPLVDVKSGRAKVPMVYAIGTVDASGRVRDQSIIEAMGWEAGQTLTITASAGAVIIRRDPRGVFTVATTLHLTIPAPLRTRYRLTGGDRVLLVAARAHATLLIYTMALLHQTLAEPHVLLLGGDVR
jgi:bifunctional DNA-binding transcriptional regulator/antitoxin component of YhaV-PrlF toxin-antitoxin module